MDLILQGLLSVCAERVSFCCVKAGETRGAEWFCADASKVSENEGRGGNGQAETTPLQSWSKAGTGADAPFSALTTMMEKTRVLPWKELRFSAGDGWVCRQITGWLTSAGEKGVVWF